jgi:hypothetical protein
MKILDILITEGREAFIAQQMGPALLKAFSKDNAQAKVPNADATYIVSSLAMADPSPNKMYLQWICNMYAKGMFRFEDFYRLRYALSDFHDKKALFPNKDISQFKTLSDLEDAVDSLKGQAPSKKKEVQKIKTEGADKVYEDDKCVLLRLKTKQAACYYGRGTKWCTAATDADGEKNMFDSYNEDSPLFVLIDKKTNDKYQLHASTRQFMDETDSPVQGTELERKYPEAIQAFVHSSETDMMIKGDYGRMVQLIGELNWGHAKDVPVRLPNFEKQLIKNKDANWLIQYCTIGINKQMPEFEPIIFDAIREGQLGAYSKKQLHPQLLMDYIGLGTNKDTKKRFYDVIKVEFEKSIKEENAEMARQLYNTLSNFGFYADFSKEETQSQHFRALKTLERKHEIDSRQ